MQTTTAQRAARQPQPKKTPASVREVLAALVGRRVTVPTLESLEDAPIGRQLRPSWYQARLAALGRDFVVLHTQYQRRGKDASVEPVQQYVPIARIKRVSVMKSEVVLHL